MSTINQLISNITVESIAPFVRVLILPAIFAVMVLDENRLHESTAKKSKLKIIVEFAITMTLFFRITTWVISGR